MKLSSFTHFISHREKVLIMNVLVFKTSVSDKESIVSLRAKLDSLAGTGHWNFALDDRDRILRIAAPQVRPEMAIELLGEFGFECLELED